MKMWDGRFTGSTDSLMDEFNSSLITDMEFFNEDIEGSKAWAEALCKAGILTDKEYTVIVESLSRIREDMEHGRADFKEGDEDIHMAVERLLTEDTGAAGEKLHTGRSRNDQVANDFRMYTKRMIELTLSLVTELQEALIQRAQDDMDTIVSGYTHLQQAQPVSMSHYWMSLFFILERDKKRLKSAFDSADILVLGSGALAGTGFNIDRNMLAERLGFSRVSSNSMDGVGSRDFVLEALSALNILGTNLSRYAEDLIIWSSSEFGYISLSDSWSTGSSMMPQKKNPDSLELIRGKSGRIAGNLTGFVTTVKGVGMTYYKDLQEDKRPLIDSFRQTTIMLRVLKGVVSSLSVNRDVIREKLNPLLLTTDLADYLVEKGVPFRKAHNITGRIVGDCLKESRTPDTLSVQELQGYSPEFGSDAKEVFKWENALKHRDIKGGTGPESLKAQIQEARRLINM